jgi:hypothetical protein
MANFKFKSNWETGDKFQGQFLSFSLAPVAHACNVTEEEAHTGKKSVRFELRATDPEAGASKRAELYIPKDNLPGYDFWAQVWIKLPADFAYDEEPELHIQFHTSSKTRIGSPLLGLWVQEGKWKVVQAFDPTNSGVQTVVPFDLGDVIKGQWVQWVFHNRFSIESDGLIEVWRDGVKVLNIEGANFNAEPAGTRETKPIFKFGIYKWRWKSGTPPFTPDTRVIFIDDVWLADETATITDFTDPIVPPADGDFYLAGHTWE